MKKSKLWLFLFGVMAVLMAVILPLCVFFTRADVGLWGRAFAAETDSSNNTSFNINGSDINMDNSADVSEEPAETPSEEPAETPSDESVNTEDPVVVEEENNTTDNTDPEPVTLEPAASVSFAVLTDLQGESGNAILADDRLKNQTATIFLGDLIEDDDNNDSALQYYNWIKSTKIETINSSTVMVIGNHDNNSHEQTGYIQKSSLTGENGKTYGYVDYDAARLRLIYIDTSDYEMFHGANSSTIGNYDINWNNVPYISLQQLHDVAEYLSSTPENYSVVIAGHYPTLGAGSYAYEIGGQWYGFSIKPLISLIRAYNNHTTCRITYSDYTVEDWAIWWSGGNCWGKSVDDYRTCLCTPTLGPSGDGKLHAEYVSEYDEQGYIDVDFTQNTTNTVMAYVHGHTHNFSSTQAHKILDDTAAVYDFVEIGMAAAASEGKGSTDWNDGQSASWDYTSEEGCSDYYRISGNKDWTSGQHASILTINTDAKSIYVQNISTKWTGFDRSAICDLSSAEYGVKRVG